MADIQQRPALLHERYPQWAPRTITQQLTATARSFPDRPYLVSDRQEYSYTQLHDRSRELAAGLIAAADRRRRPWPNWSRVDGR